MNRAFKLAAIVAAIVIAGIGVLAGPAAAQTGVTVLRGTASDTDSGKVTVLRGWQVGAKRPAKARAPRGAAPGWIATGGETLWLVERGGGRVIGCWLQGSTQAGETDIRCAQGGLR
jgi:hypothetical protein